MGNIQSAQQNRPTCCLDWFSCVVSRAVGGGLRLTPLVTSVIKGLHSVKSSFQLFIFGFLLARLAGARLHRVVLG